MACFGDENHTNSSGPTSQGEGTPRLRTGIPNSSRTLGAYFLSLGLPLLLGRPPLLWVISVVIYSSLSFILLLHLSVIHVYPQVHVLLATLSGAL